MGRLRTSGYLLAFALWAGGCAIETDGPEGDIDKIHGGEIELGHPAVGLLIKDGRPSCTGTLVGPRHVLTAAHCFTDVSPRQELVFLFGTDADDEQATRVPVQSYLSHPGYLHRPEEDHLECDRLPTSFVADIAIIELASPVQIEPVELATELTEDIVGTDVELVGFGRIDGDGNGIGTKRSATFRVQQLEVANLDVEFDSEQTFCKGDSGGAVLLEQDGVQRLAAVISNIPGGLGVPCGSYGALRGNTVRTDVVSFLVDMFVDYTNEHTDEGELIGAHGYQVCGVGSNPRIDFILVEEGTRQITIEASARGGRADLLLGSFTGVVPMWSGNAWSAPGATCVEDLHSALQVRCVVEDPEPGAWYVMVGAIDTVSFDRRIWIQR